MKFAKKMHGLLCQNNTEDRARFTEEETFALKEYVKVKSMLDDLRANVEKRHTKGSVQQKIQDIRREKIL